jgi:hypothetical protein
MEPTDDLSRVYALSPHEQLTYWTGAIAQNDVDLENAMRRLATSILLSPTLGRADFPREFEALRETTKAILRASPLPQELRTEGVTILGGAKIAHRNRVELVHDMWALREGPTPPSFVVAHALMGRGWPVDPGPSRTLADFEAAARQHIASITEVGMFSMRVSTFYADEATALFVRTQIAARFVGGPLNDQYRAVPRNDRGEAEEFFTEDSFAYARVEEGRKVVDGVVEYANLRFELVED